MSQFPVPQNDDIGVDFLAGGGELGALMRAHDWAKTPLGRPERWPQSLRSAVSICLNSRFPIAIYWGSELALLYNDAWSPIPGEKHPWALGRPGRDVWPEIWDRIGPLYASVQSSGEGVWQQDQLLPMHRHGYTEECYFNFTFSPIRGEGGSVDGIFNAVVETTFRVIDERRTLVLRDLAERTAAARSAKRVCALAAEVLGAASADVPFCLFYLIDADTSVARLSGVAGLASISAARPDSFNVTDPAAPWPAMQALTSGRVEVVSGVSRRFKSPLSGGIWPEPAESALIAPIAGLKAGKPAGFLIVGVSPRRAVDKEYRAFVERAAAQVAAVIANANAYEEERRRAEALAELDRDKTAFFSNISHEFRTPLTLMLGPLEEALDDSERLLPEERVRIATAHRNGLRLLKLVNTLLDFSRIEAGRVQANYQATDLASFTVDLASNFQAAMDKAGLRFVIDCPPLPQQAHVDRDMWEKIVLNLLSNAFKFTFDGEVAVSLRPSEDGSSAVFVVRDTGTGIPEGELPRLFERFHRVEGARGRTAEGSGIGLALGQELVKLHRGSIEVTSRLGAGTQFTVTIPFGSAHLPAEQINQAPGQAATTIRAGAFVEEALRWTDEGAGSPPEPFTRSTTNEAPHAAPGTGAGRRVLIADDNSDMRAYLRRLLVGAGYAVEAANDGEAALQAARRSAPDLVVCDIMMPRLDGFGLLAAVRGDAELRATPVILLSARAGNEARAQGLAAGADEYLVKPFSARDLLASVSSNLMLARIRSEAEQKLREEAHVLETLNRTGAAVAAELDLERAVQVVTDAATELTGAAFGAFFYNVLDASGESYMLYTISGVPREAFSKFPMPRNTAVFGPTFRGEGIVRSDDITKDPRYGKSDTHHGMPKEHLPVKSYLAAPVVSRSGEVLGGLFFGHPDVGIFTERAERILAGVAPQAALAIDNARLYQAAQLEIAERRKVEAHQEFLLAELNHRVRNMLAVVMGIASQTARGSDSVKVFTDSFLGRLTSLSRANAMLTDRNWTPMPVRTLVEAAMAAHSGGSDGRIALSGPDVTLKPKTAVSVSMILHELVTNAAKYGALAAPEGRIEVAWQVKEAGEAASLRIEWKERGMRDVQPPRRRGFGTRMIEMSATHELGGTAKLSYEPDGLSCELEFPLTQ